MLPERSQDINDLITLNLDVEQFAMDVIVQSEGSELLRAFWHALHGTEGVNRRPGVSVLDPTCGSGAFLFAALNVLEPLYSACLEGMRGFVDDLDHIEPAPQRRNIYSDFRDCPGAVDADAPQRAILHPQVHRPQTTFTASTSWKRPWKSASYAFFLKLVSQLQHL